MYDCHTLMKLLYPYLDGELDIKESLRVQTHLQECPYCLEIFRQEKEFLQEFKASVTAHKAPSYLRNKIIGYLQTTEPSLLFTRRESTPRPRFSFSPTGLLASTAAMVVMVIIGLVLYALPKQAQKHNLELVEAAVENHAGIVKGKIHFDIMSSEPSVILDWLQQGVDFPVLLPQDEGSSMRLVGGRLVHLREKKAAFLTFETEGGKVSLLMTSPQIFQAIEGKVIPFKSLLFYMSHYKGYYALAWTDPQLSYVLVSDQKAKITDACRICHGARDRDALSEFDHQI